MPQITFYGASDDLLEIEGYFEEEFYLKENNTAIAEVIFGNDEGILYVIAEFGAEGWELSVANGEEWPKGYNITFGERTDYESDPSIIMQVPEGTIVREFDADE